MFAPVPVPSAVMNVPAETPVPVNCIPTVKRPVPWVVSVNVVVAMDPLVAAVVAVVVVVADSDWNARFVVDPCVEF